MGGCLLAPGGVLSIQTSHRPSLADQRNANEAAG